jgi:hypothetical protein
MLPSLQQQQQQIPLASLLSLFQSPVCNYHCFRQSFDDMKCLGFLLGVVVSNAWAFTTHPGAAHIATQSLINSGGTDRHGATTTVVVASTRKSTRTCLEATRGDGAVVIDRDFRVAGIFLTAGLLLDTLPVLKFTLGPLITALGVLFLVQTFRLKFVCDESSFSLENTANESGENIVVGGENRWNYDSFVNYDFFPEGWIDQPQGPILVYFKETQTPSDKWNDGPGKSANSEEAIARGALPGQVHFFPALCNSKQLRDEWAKRGCQKL